MMINVDHRSLAVFIPHHRTLAGGWTVLRSARQKKRRSRPCRGGIGESCFGSPSFGRTCEP